MSKLSIIASEVSKSLVSKYNTFIGEVADGVAAIEADKETTTTTYDADIVAISDGEKDVQAVRAKEEEGFKAARASIITRLKTGSVDPNVMESLGELQNQAATYKAEYGVDLTTATTEASASRAAFNTELGSIVEFSRFFEASDDDTPDGGAPVGGVQGPKGDDGLPSGGGLM
tara:strand:+ start:41 stop:559 length:519 start_codon:yes stop_codon:yes gene_type:complete